MILSCILPELGLVFLASLNRTSSKRIDIHSWTVELP